MNSFKFLKPPKPTVRNGIRTITKTEKNIAREAYKHGKSWEEIAKWLKCSVDNLSQCIPLKYFVKN